MERRTVTSRYHGSTISGWQQNQRRRWRQGYGQKIMFMLRNNNFARASSYFVQFFAIVAPLRHETSKFREPALLSTVNTWTQKLSLSFPNLDNHRYGPKENFAKICQIKWNWIRSVKSEIVRIDFEVTLSVCCHPNILPPWQRDVTTSPLYWQDHKLIKRWDFNS